MKHVRRCAQFQEHGHTCCHQVLFRARQDDEGNSRHSDRNIGEHATSYATIKNWVAQFKHGDFSTCDAPHPERPKQ